MVISMKKFLKFMDIFVFVSTTLAIAGVFYEGMELKWFDFVGILVIFMDYSFLMSTVLNLFIERKSKWFKWHIFSALLLIIAILMKVAGMQYSSTLLVFWYFYIWLLYGAICVENYYQKIETLN